MPVSYTHLKAELKNNDVKVDAFTSATLNKSRTAGMMNGNSAYHVDSNGTDVTGVTFPVKVSDLSLLKDQKQVTDSDSVTITVTNRDVYKRQLLYLTRRVHLQKQSL